MDYRSEKNTDNLFIRGDEEEERRELERRYNLSREIAEICECKESAIMKIFDVLEKAGI